MSDSVNNQTVEAKLQELGLQLPPPSPPAANYVPALQSGQGDRKYVFVSGQLPFKNGELEFLGKLGKDFSVEEGQQAAQLCALNILAQVKEICGGDFARVKQCVRLGGFVNGTDDFTDQPKVLNGASDLMGTVLGDQGRHSRSAIGVNSLPLGVAVEVEALFEIE